MSEPVEHGRVWRHKAFILTAGALITFYAIYVLWYSLLSPYIGFQYTFSTVVGRVDGEYLRVVARGSEPPAPPTTASGDPPSIEFVPPLEEYKIVQLGDYQIRVWPQLPRALLKTEALLERGDSRTAVRRGDEEFVLVKLEHGSEPQPVWVWCRLDSPPIDFLFPSVLWLFLKLGLFA